MMRRAAGVPAALNTVLGTVLLALLLAFTGHSAQAQVNCNIVNVATGIDDTVVLVDVTDGSCRVERVTDIAENGTDLATLNNEGFSIRIDDDDVFLSINYLGNGAASGFEVFNNSSTPPISDVSTTSLTTTATAAGTSCSSISPTTIKGLVVRLNIDDCTNETIPMTVSVTKDSVVHTVTFTMVNYTDDPAGYAFSGGANAFVASGPAFVSTTPELDIRNSGDTLTIGDGSAVGDVSAALGTAFASVEQGTNGTTNSFRAENNGTGVLTFGSDALSISNTTDFTIISDLTNSGTVAAGNVETFSIRFNPQTTGQKTATVTVNSDDADEGVYTFVISGTGLDTTAPTVTAGNISISGATGTGGAFKIGDTVTATWDNTASGDNNSDVASVAVNFTEFGGGATVAASNSSNTWTATHTITAGSIDATARNVFVTATDNASPANSSAAVEGTDNATVDNVAPVVTDGNIAISGGSGTGGAFKIGDTVTATWDNTASGDNNSDTISSVSMNFSAFGGGAAVAASNSSNTWTATFTITAGAIDATNLNVSVTATDNQGNATTTADSTNATVDSVAPTVTDGNITLSGASGIGGAFKIGDTVTATWNNTGAGDNNGDIASVSVNFSAFGGGAAVAASNSSNTYTATFTVTAGAIDATNLNVSVTATDNQGNATTTADSSNATLDNIAPTVTVNIVDTALNDGDNVSNVTFTFSEAPVGFVLGDVATSGGTANGFSGSGVSFTATFTATDGVTVTGSASVPGTSFTDDAGNTGTTASDTVAIDTANPTVTVNIVDASLNDADNVSSVTFTFSETVTGFTAADLTVAGGGISGFSGSGANYTATFTATDNSTTAGSVTVDAGSYTDAVGNTGASGNDTVTINTVNPTVTVNIVDTALSDSNNNSSVTFTFSESVTGFAAGDLTVAGGVVSGFAGSGANYTATFTATDNSTTTGSVAVNVNSYTNAAGNLGASGSDTVTVDTVNPTVVVNIVDTALNDLDNASNVTFTFSETVTGFDASDLNVAQGTISGFSGSGANYSATFTATDGVTATGSVSVNAGSYADAAGNAGASGSDTVAVDTNNPTVTVNIVDTALSDSDTASNVTFVFSVSVTGFDASDLTVAGGAISGFSGSGANYSATFTATDGVAVTGSVTVNAGSYTDAGGNPGAAGSDTVAVDTANPTVTVNIVDMALNDVDNVSNVTFTFSESVTGFAAGDLTVAGGVISGFSGSGANYTATFTATDNSTTAGSVTVNAGSYTDAVGNTGASGSDTVTIDTTNPGVTVNIVAASLSTVANTSNVTFTFTTAPTGFTAADLTVTGGTISGFSGSGTSYNATLTATNNSTANATVSVNAGSYTNGAGNPGTSGSDTASVDTVTPTVLVNIVDAALNDTDNASNVTFTFSESVTGFAAGDLTVAGGVISGFAGSGANYTATFTATDGSTTTGSVAVNANSYTDAVGNLGAAGSDTVTVNTANPTVTVNIVDATLSDSDNNSSVTFTFSESVTGFAAGDLTVAGGVISGFSGSGANYTATFTATDNSTTAGSVAVNAGSYVNAVGNAGAAGSDTVTVDTVNPTVTVDIVDTTLNDVDNASNVTFTFSESVTGFAAGDLTVAGGVISGFSGSGANYTATFTATDNSTTAGSVTVNAGSYTDAVGNLGASGSDTVTINTVNPTVMVNIVDATLSDTDNSSNVTFTFSEAVTGFDASDLSLVNGAISGFAGSGANYTATFTATDGAAATGSVTVNASSYVNAAGNPGAAGSDTVTVDTANPRVATVLRQNPAAAITNADSLVFRVTFTEDVQNVDQADFQAVGSTGASIAVAMVSASTYDVTLSGGNLAGLNGAVGLGLSGGPSIADLAGNNLTNISATGSTQSFTLDNTPAAVSSITPAPAPPAATSVTFTITYDSAVTGVTADDFTLTKTGSADGTLAAPTGSGTTWTMAVTGISGQGTLRVDHNGTTDVVDAVGNGNGTNGNVAAFSSGGTHTVDREAPRLATIARQNPTAATTNADSLVFRVTFSQDVQNVDQADFQAVGPTGASIAVAMVSASTYDVTLSGGDLAGLNGPVSLGLSGGPSIADLAGNSLTDTSATGSTQNFVLDNSGPTVAISSTSSGTVTGAFPISVVFSEQVTGFAQADLVVSGASVSGFTTSDNTTFTATLTPTADGSVTADVAASVAQDSSGNDNTAAAQFSIGADITAPTLTIAGPSTPQSGTFSVTITASEAISGLALGDIQVTNATAANLSGASGTSFTVDITNPVNGTTVDVTIPAGAVADAAGNSNTAAANFQIAAGSPVTEFAQNRDDIIDTVQGDVNRNILNDINANAQMMDNALSRFITEQNGGTTRDVPFDVTGTAEISGLSFSTKGDFYGLKNLSSGTTRYIFGQFDAVRDENGSSTGQLSGRAVWEYHSSDRTKLGYFLGGRLGKSNISGSFSGDATTLGVLGGVYGLTQMGEALYGAGYLAAGYSQSDLSISNGTLAVNGDFGSRSYYAGFELAGQIRPSTGLEIRPNLAVDYGYAQIGVAGFDATAFGLTAPVSADFGSVSILEGSASPEMILSLGDLTSLSFAPSLICRTETGRTTTSDCGGGLAFGVQHVSETGLTRVDAGYEFTDVGGTQQQSLRLTFEMAF